MLVAQRDANKKTWFNPVLVPPFAKDTSITLKWIDVGDLAWAPASRVFDGGRARAMAGRGGGARL